MVHGSTETDTSRPPNGLSRRTIIQGAAWSIPIVMVGSPARAFTATGCVVEQTFAGLVDGTNACAPAVIEFPPSLVTATLTVDVTNAGPQNCAGGTGTCRVFTTTDGSNFSYVELEMCAPITAGNYIDATLTFSEPVEKLGYFLHDIDSDAGGYQDTVVITTPGFTRAFAPGTSLTGAGTAGDPIQPQQLQSDQPISSDLGAVGVFYDGPISSVSFRYRAGISGNSTNQRIGLSRIRFEDCVEPAPASPQRRSLIAPAPRTTTSRDESLKGDT